MYLYLNIFCRSFSNFIPSSVDKIVIFRSSKPLADDFIKKETPTQVSPVNFAKNIRTLFLLNTSRRLLLNLASNLTYLYTCIYQYIYGTKYSRMGQV